MLPLFIFLARAYLPTDAVVSQVAAIYWTALRVSSWGLTLPIQELLPTLGGKHVPQPRTFLLWHHATAAPLQLLDKMGRRSSGYTSTPTSGSEETSAPMGWQMKGVENPSCYMGKSPSCRLWQART